MKKITFLTTGILALAITCSLAEPGRVTGTGSTNGDVISIKTTNGTFSTDTVKTKKAKLTKYEKKQMRKGKTNATDTARIIGRGSLPDGTDPRGTGNNGNGGNGTGNGGNGGVGTGKPSNTGGIGSGSGTKVKP